ncbi:DUF4250 domain-containing protein [Prevotella falsenii]|uniref:DUF4250 domain-containing protein n=1 Tax=Prevotella falsenii TaxID=515414 RepID=UPI00046A5433|nr:DUF4250 domain-containing protein [Prevotella falsenii]
MEKLPNDPAILVSAVNMLLRDEEFDTLSSLCYYFNETPEHLQTRLKTAGFVYSERQKQFRPIGYDE